VGRELSAPRAIAGVRIGNKRPSSTESGSKGGKKGFRAVWDPPRNVIGLNLGGAKRGERKGGKRHKDVLPHNQAPN